MRGFRNFQGMTALNVAVLILLLGVGIRFLLAIMSHGGGDATNGASFIDLHRSGYDIYSVRSPWPYFPFSNHLLLVWEWISNSFDISINLAYRLTSSFFDAMIALLIYFYFLAKNFNITSAARYALIYAVNPLTILIVATLGFTDSIAIFFLIGCLLIFELYDVRLKRILVPLFLMISVSIKPVALFLYPYFLYHSAKKGSFLLFSAIFFVLLNSYYLFGADIEGLRDVFLLILEKITSGHQASRIGLGAFDDILGLSTLKVITAAGAVFVLLAYLANLGKTAIEFIVTMFTFLLLFRYNLHIQYLFWLVPFLILSQRKVLLYLAVFSVVFMAVIPNWAGSTGALVTHAIIGLDTVDRQIFNTGFYTFVSDPIFIGILSLFGFVSLLKAKDVTDIIMFYRGAVALFPKVGIGTVLVLLTASVLVTVTYIVLSVDVGLLRFGETLRMTVFSLLPTFLFFYLTYSLLENNRVLATLFWLILYAVSLGLSAYWGSVKISVNLLLAYGLLLGVACGLLVFRKRNMFGSILGKVHGFF